MGRLEMWPEAKQVSENATFLHHWGLTHDYPYSNWKAAHRPGQDIVVPVRECKLAGRALRMHVFWGRGKIYK